MSNQLGIAAQILAVLAYRKGQGAVTSTELAEGLGTNPVVVRRVLLRLQKAGLVTSKRGTGGGSVLARAPETISLCDAYLAVHERMNIGRVKVPNHCAEGVDIAPIVASFINEFFGDAEQALLRRLAEVSIHELQQEIAAKLSD